MDRPALAVRGSLRHIFASRLALGMSCLGVAILVVGAAVGPVGAALAVVTAGGLAWQWRRLRRRRIEVDEPGDGAMLRLGRDAATTVPLADVAGGIVHRTRGSTYRGIRTGANVERWLVVGHDGRVLARLDGRGFAAADLAAARHAIGGTWMSAAEALRAGAMPGDAPWDMRRPGAATAVAMFAALAALVLLGAALVALTVVGRDAFLWPWW